MARNITTIISSALVVSYTLQFNITHSFSVSRVFISPLVTASNGSVPPEPQPQKFSPNSTKATGFQRRLTPDPTSLYHSRKGSLQKLI
jgi:hypothetical protein